jgi:hypothetical protein
MSEPKTRDEILQEKLKKINSRLVKVKPLIGTTKIDLLTRIEKSELRHSQAKGKPRFVRVNATMVEGTDELECLLELENHYEMLMDLENKDPHAECVRLLKKKMKYLKELINLH